ncbi:MAG: helix-turn-helix transcriptional regulator [Alphaproteobacteria bacterium]|nr:helix-turn-helix transcriptional regulator [Alphaproteobacteria bacterium]
MSDTARAGGALSPQTADDTMSIVAGQPSVERLRRLPSESRSAFDSLCGLSTHLSEVFGARLVFVSCRDTLQGNVPDFLFDTVRSAFAAERAKLYGLEMPLDVAIAMTGRPFLWRPKAAIATIAEKPAPEATSAAARPSSNTLVAVPFQCGSVLALCVVMPASEPAAGREDTDLVAWHCIQFLPEHFQHHPMRQSARAQLLSPQEERIILKCADGLTDKEIGRDMAISPHTVRTHINSAKTKLGAKNKTHAVILFNELSAKS